MGVDDEVVDDEDERSSDELGGESVSSVLRGGKAKDFLTSPPR